MIQFHHGIHPPHQGGFHSKIPRLLFWEILSRPPCPFPQPALQLPVEAHCWAMDSKSTQVARNLVSVAAPRIDFLARLLTVCWLDLENKTKLAIILSYGVKTTSISNIGKPVITCHNNFWIICEQMKNGVLIKDKFGRGQSHLKVPDSVMVLQRPSENVFQM